MENLSFAATSVTSAGVVIGRTENQVGGPLFPSQADQVHNDLDADAARVAKLDLGHLSPARGHIVVQLLLGDHSHKRVDVGAGRLQFRGVVDGIGLGSVGDQRFRNAESVVALVDLISVVSGVDRNARQDFIGDEVVGVDVVVRVGDGAQRFKSGNGCVRSGHDLDLLSDVCGWVRVGAGG